MPDNVEMFRGILGVGGSAAEPAVETFSFLRLGDKKAPVPVNVVLKGACSIASGLRFG